jgi:hypothetical protein
VLSVLTSVQLIDSFGKQDLDKANNISLMFLYLAIATLFASFFEVSMFMWVGTFPVIVYFPSTSSLERHMAETNFTSNLYKKFLAITFRNDKLFPVLYNI